MRLLAAELLKVWTTPRTIFGLLAAELALVAIGAASTVQSASNSPTVPPSVERELVDNATAALFFAILLGILIATTEYRHGTITQTFLATPVRERVIGVKALAAGLLGSALVLPAAGVAFGIAEVWIGRSEGFDVGSDVLVWVAQLMLAAAVGGLFGLFVGASLGRQLGAIILVLGWLVFVEPALSALVPSVREYLPARAIGGLLGTSGSDAPPLGRAAAESAAYLVALGSLAVVVTRRRDIT